MLGHLDTLEKHPTHYTRTLEQFTMVENGDLVQAEMYLMKEFKPELLNLPFHTNYSSETNGKKYITRYSKIIFF